MGNDINNLNWYVLYTAPRAEKQVRERIKLQDIECWLPLHRTPRVWSDRVKLVDVPLFHSYIFVKCAACQLYALLKVYGVSRIVFFDGKPALIRQSEIEAIKDFLVQSANHPLLVGDEVEILAGAMKHISGKVKKIKKTYLVLYLEQLGATVSVNLEQVAPMKRLK
ncbi:MAG: UpxY family transcription antiterminator [Tannerellaceae bacterium]|jgi:transcription antitermination factor NusG|nr:UpxY family transcription antiterminator [Tannerellaceae bacterium]